MIVFLRNSKIVRWVWAFMALYLFNISVDTNHSYPDGFLQEVGLNEQDSFIELILEEVLGIENALAEYDNEDSEEHRKKESRIKELLLHNEGLPENHPTIFKAKKERLSAYRNSFYSVFLDLDTPPPKG